MRKYTGPFDRKKMPSDVRLAYEAYCSAKARSKRQGLPPPEPTAREFIDWWLTEKESFTGTVATCGRIDHCRGYSWDNFEMQDMAENSREGAIRNRLGDQERLKNAKSVFVYIKGTRQLTGIIHNIRMAARFFKVSQRQIQFMVRGQYKNSSKINFDLRSEMYA